jgi:hypothetical protein
VRTSRRRVAHIAVDGSNACRLSERPIIPWRTLAERLKEKEDDVVVEDVGPHEPVELRLALALDTGSCTRLPCAAWLDAVMSSHFIDMICPRCPPSHSGSERSLLVERQESRIGVYEVCIPFATHLRLSIKLPIAVEPEICPPPFGIGGRIAEVDIDAMIPVTKSSDRTNNSTVTVDFLVVAVRGKLASRRW